MALAVRDFLATCVDSLNLIECMLKNSLNLQLGGNDLSVVLINGENKKHEQISYLDD